MKHLIIPISIIILLIGNFAQAQKADKKKIKRDGKNMAYYNAVESGSDKIFEISEVPVEWADESYVFIAIQNYLTVGSKSGKQRGINRKRVLLQDKNATELFSEFYFQASETALITVTKKDGEEIQIDTKDAIKISTQVPSVYSGRFQSSESYKLVIPNLEIGDILDYTSIYNQDLSKGISYADVLNTSVPILNQNITIDIHKDWDVYRNTFNTNAKIVLSKQNGHNYDGEIDPTLQRFVLETGRLEAQKDVPWENAYAVEPIIKFLAISPKDKQLHSGVGIVSDKISLPEMVINFYKHSLEEYKSLNLLGDLIVKNIKKTTIDQSKIDKGDASYYYLRESLNDGYYPQNAISAVKLYNRTYESIYENYSRMDESVFLYMFPYILSKMKVKHEIVGIIPDYIGGVDMAVTLDDVIFGVYVPETNTYYYPPNKNKTHLDVPYSLVKGGEGIGIAKNMIFNKNAIINIRQMPPISYTTNKEHNSVGITINVAENLLNIKKNCIFSGYFKESNSGLLEEFGDEMYLDFLSMYNDEKVMELQDAYQDNVEKDKKGIYKDFIAKSDKNMADNFTNFIKLKDKNVNLLSYELLASGRVPLQPVMKIDVSFTSDGWLKKLGPNYIFDAGMLIDGQIFIDEKYRVPRQSEIDFGSCRQYVYDISITIPDGYTIDNIDNLHKSVVNPYCSFISTAEKQNDKIIIKSIKSYLKPKAPKEAWQEILEVMDTAYKFSQEKVLLKKV